ncbi:MAG: hypothetical protein J5846_04020 [Desulfovibrio sp.]|nr:hypothetical protein [Desulfovibrio sp.]
MDKEQKAESRDSAFFVLPDCLGIFENGLKQLNVLKNRSFRLGLLSLRDSPGLDKARQTKTAPIRGGTDLKELPNLRQTQTQQQEYCARVLQKLNTY